MSRVLTAVALCLGPVLPASAQGVTAGEAATLPRLIDAECLDLIEDAIGCEQAILLASESAEDSADLIILTDRRSDTGGVPLLVARDIAFNGALWGMSPWLEQAENGSLLVMSEQTGIGRQAWSQVLTLAWRDGGFVVAGLTWQSYDRLTGSTADCDVNLLTGDYAASAVKSDPATGTDRTILSDQGRIEGARIPAADWGAMAVFPAPCAAAQSALSEG